MPILYENADHGQIRPETLALDLALALALALAHALALSKLGTGTAKKTGTELQMGAQGLSRKHSNSEREAKQFNNGPRVCTRRP